MSDLKITHTKKVGTINMAPSWKAAATIYGMTLLNQDGGCRDEAYREIVQMGCLIDELQDTLKSIRTLVSGDK